MKRTLPLLITALAGLVLIVSQFIPAMQKLGEDVAVWFDILASMAFVLGGGNLLRLQLQTISDRRPGWGYAAVTLGSFLLMLFLGMFKIGCPPQPSAEDYGNSQVRLSPAALPETRVSGVIPVRGDGTLLPPVFREILRQDGNDIVVRGWLNETQLTALAKFDDALSWQVVVQDLGEAALPPQLLRDKLSYDAEHFSLSWLGFMSAEEEAALRQLMPSSAGQASTSAVNALVALAHAATTREVTNLPAGFTIPAAAAAQVQRVDNTLTVNGPMSPALRRNLVQVWPAFERVRPLTASQQAELRSQLEAAGAPLNAKQAEVFQAYFAADWTSEALIQAINTAGVAAGELKTPRELQAEVRAGVERPELRHPAPPPSLLNDAQQQAVRSFVENPTTTAAELKSQLATGGTLTDGQSAAIGRFLQNQLTVGEHRHVLCFKLLREGPLAAAQRELLLSQSREQFLWRQQVGRLFIASHKVKYPWAGEYDAQGSPFWWLYEYVFQPLTTSTFAVLAFYVASAAFRAFRAKNLEAVLLLGTAFIILLGRTFAGQWLTAGIPDALSALRIDQMTVYIMSIFNTSGNRAIMIGIALGTISTSLQVLLGIDRSYLGRGDK